MRPLIAFNPLGPSSRHQPASKRDSQGNPPVFIAAGKGQMSRSPFPVCLYPVRSPDRSCGFTGTPALGTRCAACSRHAPRCAQIGSRGAGAGCSRFRTPSTRSMPLPTRACWTSSRSASVLPAFSGTGTPCIAVPVERARRRAGAGTQTSADLSRRAFVMTETELKLIAAAAMIGESRRPNCG